MRIFEPKKIIPQLPNLVLKRRLEFEFERLPFEATRLSVKKRVNFFMAGLNQFFLPPHPMGYPVIAQVEPTNFCNLSCPTCLTTSENNSRPRASLAFDPFKRLIDDVGDYLLLIVLWNWGEPFLNPDIYKMIAYAKAKNIIVHSSTNGNVRFDADKSEELVNSGLDSLVIAVDGATQESYGKFRKRGSLEKLLNNVRNIQDAKKRMGSLVPRLNMRIVVTKDNEQELPKVRELVEQLGADFFTIRTVVLNPIPDRPRDEEYVPKIEKYRPYEYERDSFVRKERPFVCMRPWKRITLDALGEVVSCEYDYKNSHSFGNLSSKASAMQVWKSKAARVFRRQFNRGDNAFYHCKDCIYRNRIDQNCTVERVL